MDEDPTFCATFGSQPTLAPTPAPVLDDGDDDDEYRERRRRGDRTRRSNPKYPDPWWENLTPSTTYDDYGVWPNTTASVAMELGNPAAFDANVDNVVNGDISSRMASVGAENVEWTSTNCKAGESPTDIAEHNLCTNEAIDLTLMLQELVDQPSYSAESTRPTILLTRSPNSARTSATRAFSYYENDLSGGSLGIKISIAYTTQCPVLGCNACPAGSACPEGTTSTTILACDAGQYSVEGSSECSDCPVGYSCASPTVEPVACSPGTYAPSPKSTACQLCPAGRRCPTCVGPARNRRSEEEEEEAAPTYRFVKCSATQMACSSGSSCQVTCDLPTGYYCDPDDETAYCFCSGNSGTSSSRYERCPGSQWWDPVNHVCNWDYNVNRTDCPVQDRPWFPIPAPPAPPATTSAPDADCASSTSIVCAAGTYSPLGATDCIDTPDGFYTQAGASVPVPLTADCAAGEIIPSGGQDCVPCTLGTYPNPEASACIQCPAGHECLDPRTPPVPCAPGWWRPQDKSEHRCALCPAGHSCADAAVRPTECAAGSYAPAGSPSCYVCPIGSACPDAAATVPTPCPRGAYATSTSSKRCTTCPTGYSCEFPTQEPTLCATGSYSYAGQEDCTGCAPGYACPRALELSEIQAGENQALPTRCAEGQTVGPFTTGSVCVDCPVGFECPRPEGQPARCKPGYYAAGNNTVACTLCPAGSACSDPEATPVRCEAGFIAGAGSMWCDPCPPGHACPTPADVTAIEKCPVGSLVGTNDVDLKFPAEDTMNNTILVPDYLEDDLLDVTVCGWIKQGAVAQENMFFFSYATPVYHNTLLIGFSRGTWGAMDYTRNKAFGIKPIKFIAESATQETFREWHHYCFTKEGGTGVITIYEDGEFLEAIGAGVFGTSRVGKE